MPCHESTLSRERRAPWCGGGGGGGGRRDPCPHHRLDGNAREMQYAAGMDIAFQLQEVRAEMEGGFVAPRHNQICNTLLAGHCRHRHCPMVVIVIIIAFAAVDAMDVIAIAVVGSPNRE
jgi:hypothetical protein